MFNSLKTYLTAGLAVLSALLAAIAMYFKSSRDSAIAKGQKEARKQEQKATDAMLTGLEDENKATGDISDGKFLD